VITGVRLPREEGDRFFEAAVADGKHVAVVTDQAKSE
jgi:hypothetical protein